jgi:hypothetical protein
MFQYWKRFRQEKSVKENLRVFTVLYSIYGLLNDPTGVARNLMAKERSVLMGYIVKNGKESELA